MLRRLLRLRLRVREEKGSVVIVVAIAMTAIIGLAALSTDVGRVYVERQRIVTVADAAALSGAQRLPMDREGAITAARAILQKNGIDPATAEVTVTDDNRHLAVNLNKQVSFTFARIFGVPGMTVEGGATAWTANLSGYYGAAPLGVPRADWQIGQQVRLKMDAQDGTVSPGNYQALALGKSGAAMYEQNLMYGYKNWIRMDDWLDTETGNMAGPTVRASNYRISQDPYATYTNVTRQSPRLVIVPILESFEVNGKGQVHVIGFGLFFLEAAFDNGNNRGEIQGRFLRFVTEGEGSSNAPDFGVYTTKLIR